MLRKRSRKTGAAVDLSAQGSHQIALFLVFGFVGKGGQRAFQR